MSSNKKEQTKNQPKSFARRDYLVSIQKKMQDLWDKKRQNQSNVPEEWEKSMTVQEKNQSKYFTNFPYPYMNGRLHLGHAFTLSKCEFQARYQKLKGKNVLFPFAFHCTGMPIAACAERLRREFDNNIEEAYAQKVKKQEEEKNKSKEESKSKKGKKQDAPAPQPKSQYEIMHLLGIEPSEIKKFADPYYWLQYFPPLAKKDLQGMGVCVDWRRSFITTEINPFYDSFVQWQFRKLKERNKISYGKRHTVFSVRDNQPCADHDRSEGQGVGVEEYVAIKIELIDKPQTLQKHFTNDQRIFLPAATLRPQTMYGQTNCFILPQGQYGAYTLKKQNQQSKERQIFVCSHRSAMNMVFQNLLQAQDPAKLQPICTVSGKELIGLKCKAPLSKYDYVYTLPMTTISMKKGTGVVTSVPSDSPDDYAMLRDLQTKKGLRQKLNVDEEWVKDFEPIPILEIPEVGQLSAIKACQMQKVQSHKDAEKLKIAKDFCYKKGFYEGKMIVGLAEGKKVEDAKPIIKKHLIQKNMAVSYFEPQKLVLSRHMQECVVALVDQWMLKYGDEQWCNFITQHIKSDNFNAYSSQAQAMFEDKASWLKEWGCSRTFGLGSKIPWDQQYLIESLSDSTIYMAYYTIAHFLQGVDNLRGDDSNNEQIKHQWMNDGAWDYIFLKGPYPQGCQIKEDILKKMRNEFEYWYPMDLRISGKDLIPNHLTMSLYNHAAIWEDFSKMPRGFFCNGHIMVDGEKMSKNKGNFLTLYDCLEKYGADATRFACADSGDSLDDSNFQTSTANSAIMKLFVLEKWIKDEFTRISQELGDKKLDWSDSSKKVDDIWDVVFYYEMNKCIVEARNAFESIHYRDALKYGFHDLQGLKDDYFLAKASSSKSINPYAFVKFLQVQAKLIYPICSHFAEYIWIQYYSKFLNKFVNNYNLSETEEMNTARFPLETQDVEAVNPEICKGVLKYWRFIKHQVHLALTKLKNAGQKGKKKKGKGEAAASEQAKDDKKFSTVILVVAKEYPQQQKQILKAMTSLEFDSQKGKFTSSLVDMIKSVFPDKDPKKISDEVKFATFVESQYKTKGAQALALEMSFNQSKTIANGINYILAETGIEKHIILAAEQKIPEEYGQFFEGQKIAATPGHPSIHFIKS